MDGRGRTASLWGRYGGGDGKGRGGGGLWNKPPREDRSPIRFVRNGAEARTCRTMPRYSVVEARIAFSMKIFLGVY